MAIVVPAASKQPRLVLNDEWDGQTTRWTGTQRTNNHIKTKLKASKAKFDWTIDFLEAAQLSADDSLLRRHRIHGIRCPKPVGIVTFEDIIDTILQKTSRDENDFFDRPNATPPTKSKKAGDYSRRPVIGGIAPNSTISIKHWKGPISLSQYSHPNKLRKRKPSGNENPANMDGADERTCDTGSSAGIRVQKSRKDFVESSYTQNSQGGFHGAQNSDFSICPAIMLSMMTSEDLRELASKTTSTYSDNAYSHTKTSSLPSRKPKNFLESGARNQVMRHVSAAPVLPSLRRVTPFGRDTESYERSEEAKQTISELIMPAPPMIPAPSKDCLVPFLESQDVSILDMDGSIGGETDFAKDADCELSSNLIIMDSSEDENEEGNWTLYNAFPVPPSEPRCGREWRRASLSRDFNKTIEGEARKKPYDGFPPELLESSDENKTADYDSNTMPILKGSRISRASEHNLHARAPSFHDDRAMLPSQRKAIIQAENLVIGARSSSLWW
jgi:metal transporter CNNM